MGKRVAIVQSNYIPWKGYFDLIRACDEFVLYDEVQYTRRDWRNRNRIKTAQGTKWLTIPVQTKGRYDQRIDETLVDGIHWAEKHLRTIEQAHASAPFYAELGEPLAQVYSSMRSGERLSDINRRMIDLCCGLLGITTRISWSSDFQTAVGRNERLIGLCHAVGADTYLSGPAAAGYLDVERFAEEGISVEFASYAGYRPYPQIHGSFEHGVSVLDLLANVGTSAAGEYLIDVRYGGVVA